MDPTIRPRHKRILVEPIYQKTASALLEVVEFDKTNTRSSGVESKSYTKGRVLALGDDCDKENGARIGDVVLFTKNGGLPFHKNGKEYLILSEKDLYGIEEDAETI